jgi:outer membrane protein OmpA-like peptidoglycan-associated protein
MKLGIYAGVAGATLLLPTLLVGNWVNAAGQRLNTGEKEVGPVAQASDLGYCNADLKKVLRRVLQSCGLATGGGRGCQPLEAKNVAQMAGSDFNALFDPLADRAGIIQFDADKAELDAADTAMLDRIFADQKGASYFFVVSRASPDGGAEYNAKLSQQRGDAVLSHLRTKFNDPELDKEVGLLWLGEEVAQLDTKYCGWQRSGVDAAAAPGAAPTGAAGAVPADPAAATCKSEDLNRSAFIAWIDCRL